MNMRWLFVAVMMLTAAMLPPSLRAEDNEYGTIEEEIRTPEVKRQHAAAVTDAMKTVARGLKTAKYKVDTVRDGQVLMVTLQCADIFVPNCTELTPNAERLLRPLLPYIRRKDDFKVIVAVHADNTGDDLYAENITTDRSNALDDYFTEINNGVDTGIIPYGIGNEEPLVSNISYVNREKNRRIEIYFIPTEQFIKNSAKKH